MIKSLRKRHLQTWYALAVLLPIGIALAWVSFPAKPIETSTQPAFSNALPTLEKSVKTKQYTANLRCSEDGQNCQLEYINAKPLVIPSLLIYIMKPGAQSVDEHELLGRIESSGRYYFALPQASGDEEAGFILYDFIHGQVVDTIKF